MVAGYNLLSKAGLQWLYPPFQLCEASVTTIKSFQLMILKQIQTDCKDPHPCSEEVIMDAVLSSLQFGALAVYSRLDTDNMLIARPSHHISSHLITYRPLRRSDSDLVLPRPRAASRHTGEVPRLH